MTQLAVSSVMAGFRDHVCRVTGIVLPDTKAPLIHQRLRRRVTALGLASTEDYLKIVQSPEMAEELALATELLTTNTTSFFREPDHFRMLASQILPELTEKAGRKRLKLWSAASSEGAEAYTMAMVLAEERRKGANFDFAILGTDISSNMLDRATAAIFDDYQLTGVPKDLLHRYFLIARQPEAGSKARIVPELRARVRFRKLNLMDATYPIDRDVNVIFLRNILIYFSAEVQRQVIQRVASHLAPGGYLIVGHSESMTVRNTSLEQVVPTIFRKV